MSQFLVTELQVPVDVILLEMGEELRGGVGGGLEQD
jgi:hypothetical protein